ncbi:MAG: tetratricopeptide repeat protein [Silvanigrellaceae bacterium]
MRLKIGFLVFLGGTAIGLYVMRLGRTLATEANLAEQESTAGPSNPEKNTDTKEPKQNQAISTVSQDKSNPTAPNLPVQKNENRVSNFDAYAHFQMGNYEGAVTQLRGIVKLRPNDELNRKNLATSLLALGFFRLQKKELADAEAAFEESAKLGNPDARKALAALKLRQGQIETARELLEDLSKSGNEPENYKILIDLALSQDEIERADDMLNRMGEAIAQKAASAQQQIDPELTTFIELRRRRLEQKRNFLKTQDVLSRQGIDVSFPQPELRSSAEAVMRAIESVQSGLVQILGPLPSHARLRAWLLPTNDFRGMTDAPPWAAAVFDGYIRIPVGRSARGGLLANEVLENLARHETTHAYMYAFCGDILPSWIGEGLAQVFEGRSAAQSQADIFRSGRKALQTYEPEMDLPFNQASPKMVSRLYWRSHLLVTAMSKDGGGVIQTWQRILSGVCVQRRPLPDILQEQYSAGSLAELWTKYFGSAEPQ